MVRRVLHAICDTKTPLHFAFGRTIRFCFWEDNSIAAGHVRTNVQWQHPAKIVAELNGHAIPPRHGTRHEPTGCEHITYNFGKGGIGTTQEIPWELGLFVGQRDAGGI